MSLLNSKTTKKSATKKVSSSQTMSTPNIVLLNQEQIRALSDKDLIKYRHDVMMDKKVYKNDHWEQMWTCNAEMAKRFKKLVEEQK